MKVTVVGSGFVGQTTAMRILEQRLAEVCLIDIIEGKPQGLALDLRQAAPVEGYEPVIVGTNDYGDTAGSDVVVITAGFPRQPGMSRMDLLGKNAAIMRDVVERVAPGSPGAILIVVSNPLDEMTFLAAETSGFPQERVMGMAGVLDSARLRAFIAEELGASPNEVEAITLGSHGEAMVALPRHATVKGTPLPELVDAATLDRLFRRTRDAGAEIVGLLKSGSAYYAPSASATAMVAAIVRDTRTCCRCAHGRPVSTGSPTCTSACRRGSARKASRRSSSSTSTRTSARASGRRLRGSARSARTSPTCDGALPRAARGARGELLHELVDVRPAVRPEDRGHGPEPGEVARQSRVLRAPREPGC